MPTTRIGPDSESLLQGMANAVWKARKVVVVTGAGISTNSGIPDFRSEDGLYSLIQAQFDAVATVTASTETNDGQYEGFGAAFEPDESRLKKRRKTFKEGEGSSIDLRGNQGSPEQPTGRRSPEMEQDPAQLSAGIRSVQPKPETGGHGRSLLNSKPLGPTYGQCITVLPVKPSTGVTGATHLLSPSRSPGSTLLHEPDLPSLPPVLAPRTCRLPSDPEQDKTRTTHSSPLSSPPPMLLDPYPDSSTSAMSSSSSTPGSTPSRPRSSSSRLGGTASSIPTPRLGPHLSASSSGRTSLGNMKGKDLFDSQIWADPVSTSVFYTFATTLRRKARNAEPSSCHRFLSVLRDSRKLVRCYTQNIDQLEERVGLSTSLSLGPGNRNRFSTRPGRSAQARSQAKDLECPKQSQTPSVDQSVGGATQQDHAPLLNPDLEPGIASETCKQEDEGENVITVPEEKLMVDEECGLITDRPNRGVECVCLHGSLAELRCFLCTKTVSWDEPSRELDTLAGRQPWCPHCVGATTAREEKGKRALGVGKLRPDIVLYGEEHPHAELISPIVQHDLSLGPDLLLILGTSMRVYGLKVMVKEFAKAVHQRGGRVVLVNLTKPPTSVWGDIFDYWIQWDCDAWVSDLQQRKPSLWSSAGIITPEEEEVKIRPSRGRREAKRQRGSDAQDTALPAGERRRVSVRTNDPVQTESVPKRPAAVRDHKLNGAYLVHTILNELHKLTGGNSGPALRSYPTSVESASAGKTHRDQAKVRKPRVKKTKRVETLTKPPLSGNMPATSDVAPPETRERSPKIDLLASITATVKSRKRKWTLWKIVNGVETRVPANDGGDTQASPAARKARAKTAPRPRAIPSSPLPSFSRTCRLGHHDVDTAPNADRVEEKPFGETDRLIAQFQGLVGRPFVGTASLERVAASLPSGPGFDTLSTVKTTSHRGFPMAKTVFSSVPVSDGGGVAPVSLKPASGRNDSNSSQNDLSLEYLDGRVAQWTANMEGSHQGQDVQDAARMLSRLGKGN